MEWARVERSEIAFIILYKGLQTAIISDLTFLNFHRFNVFSFHIAHGACSVLNIPSLVSIDLNIGTSASCLLLSQIKYQKKCFGLSLENIPISCNYCFRQHYFR